MSLQRLFGRICSCHSILPKIRRRYKSTKTNESPLRRLLADASGFGEARAAEGALQWATQPYAAAAPRDAADATDAAERLAPHESVVVLFPGQGGQFVGMGRRLADIPAARELYDLASNVVGWDVWRVCTEGPEEELAARAQTAVLVSSLAALERARELRPAALQRARAAAGFSLGEVAALVFAGALTLEGALRLVEVRAAAMRAAAADRAGAMLTVWLAPAARLGAALAGARAHAAAAGVSAPVAVVANYLYADCKVLAGDEECIRWLEREGGAFGVRRSARVRVAGAFHSPLMARAAAAVAQAAALLEVRAPRLRVVSAVDARAYASAAHVRRQLARHVTAPVRWEQALHALFARPRAHAQPLTLALGPGGAPRAALRHVNARAYDCSVQVDV